MASPAKGNLAEGKAGAGQGASGAGLLGSVVRTGRFVRFSHTIFALPFALGAMLVAAEGHPPLREWLLVLVCMVSARTAAMAFNRLADWEIDRRNPRTAGRHLLLPKSGAIALLATSSAIFIGGAVLLNPLCGRLSPVALSIIFFYSLTKRFTHYTQLFLGLALAVAPVGGWLAVTGSFALPPLLLAGGVLLWVAGFDIIYATQDVEVDRREGLHSLVVKLGIDRGLRLAGILHACTVVFLAGFGVTAGLGWIYWAGIGATICALVYEHRCATSRDLDALNRAFFHSNAFVGCVFVATTWADQWLG